MIRVVLPIQLRRLANTDREIRVQVEGQTTLSEVLDALESQYPMLLGTIRDQISKQRRPFIRFFACGQDVTLEPTDVPLPDLVVAGTEPLRIVGAIAGG